jgi:peptidyl-prolyl cis-trans isomerase D
MLQSIRDRTQGWIAGIIISILILSFALWGIHSYLAGSGASNRVAKVNGVEITHAQLSAAYERMRRQLQYQYGAYQIPQQAEEGLKDRALQSLINSQILKQASIDQNYRVSSNQVDNYLFGMPELQENGHFSNAKFQQVLNNTLFSAQEFLDLISATLLMEQPRIGIIFSSFALPDEVSSTMALIGQTRNIEYGVIPFQRFANQAMNISEEKINEYYQQHENDFKTPEQVSLEYLELSLKEIKTNISTKDKAQRDQQAQEKYSDVKEKLANLTYEHPESLEAASKELKMPIKTTGLFTIDKGGKDISENNSIRSMAFSNDVLNLQNNSDVLQLTPDSVVVIRVKTHNPAALLPLSTVKNQILEKLKAVEAESQATKAIEEINQKLNSGTPISDISKQYQLTWTKAGYISRQSNKLDSAIIDAAFSAPTPSANKISYTTAKTAKGYAVIGLIDVKQGTIKPDQLRVFSEQVQNSYGLLEYELYKESLIKQSKINIY